MMSMHERVFNKDEPFDVDSLQPQPLVTKVSIDVSFPCVPRKITRWLPVPDSSTKHYCEIPANIDRLLLVDENVSDNNVEITNKNFEYAFNGIDIEYVFQMLAEKFPNLRILQVSNYTFYDINPLYTYFNDYLKQAQIKTLILSNCNIKLQDLKGTSADLIFVGCKIKNYVQDVESQELDPNEEEDPVHGEATQHRTVLLCERLVMVNCCVEDIGSSGPKSKYILPAFPMLAYASFWFCEFSVSWRFFGVGAYLSLMYCHFSGDDIPFTIQSDKFDMIETDNFTFDKHFLYFVNANTKILRVRVNLSYNQLKGCGYRELKDFGVRQNFMQNCYTPYIQLCFDTSPIPVVHSTTRTYGFEHMRSIVCDDCDTIRIPGVGPREHRYTKVWRNNLPPPTKITSVFMNYFPWYLNEEKPVVVVDVISREHAFEGISSTSLKNIITLCSFSGAPYEPPTIYLLPEDNEKSNHYKGNFVYGSDPFSNVIETSAPSGASNLNANFVFRCEAVPSEAVSFNTIISVKMLAKTVLDEAVQHEMQLTEVLPDFVFFTYPAIFPPHEQNKKSKTMTT